MKFHVTIHWSAHTIEMDALMRSVPARHVAELAPDALRLIDSRHDLVVQIRDASTP